ncbi:hypothetical protein BGP75_21590 [Motiliproteus sp. MSK22-1]|nr:hypothetical protein BGP75_21590 [Motiliproteus sp. MSK22-1]
MLIILTWITLVPAAVADHLPSPKGTVILTLSGAITHSNQPGQADFDRAMLDSLPRHQFKTASPWTEGSHLYTGVLLSELLQYVGAKGTRLIARALNDYHSVIDLDPIAEYPILLALESDGQPMKVRDKGPIWLLYPMSDYPELNTTYYHAGMVWQLRHIEVK